LDIGSWNCSDSVVFCVFHFYSYDMTIFVLGLYF
jgi:hypothetical protein